MLRFVSTLLFSFFAVGTTFAVEIRAQKDGSWVNLGTWDGALAARLGIRASQSRERDPKSGRIAQWQGHVLSAVLEKIMAPLSVEQRAHIDLLVFVDASGREVLLPRWVATKYPVLLANKRDGESISVMPVVPWTSKEKILQDELPLEAFFVSNLRRIDLANYRDRMGQVFLRRRTDPLAMRGEKLFAKNCLGCHSSGESPHPKPGGFGRRLASSAAHQSLEEGSRRALLRYFEAHTNENSLGSESRAYVGAGAGSGSRTGDPARVLGISPSALQWVR